MKRGDIRIEKYGEVVVREDEIIAKGFSFVGEAGESDEVVDEVVVQWAIDRLQKKIPEKPSLHWMDERWQEEHLKCPAQSVAIRWYCKATGGKCTEADCPFVYFIRKLEEKLENSLAGVDIYVTL